MIIIDNYDTLQDETIKKSLYHLFQTVDKTVHVIVAIEKISRMDFYEMTTKAAAYEITASDLAFTLDETAEYLHLYGFDQSQAEIVYHITEGWPLGIAFASKMNLERLSPDFRFTFDGSNREVDDFFTAFFRDRFPAGTIKSMIELSLVNVFSAQLLESIIKVKDGQSLIASLENKMAFIVPLDYERGNYRFNRLLLDWLRNKLLPRFSIEHIEDLAIKASDWFSQANQVTNAAMYNIIASDIQGISRIVSTTLGRPEDTREHLIHELIALESEEHFVIQPKYCLYSALAYILAGKPDMALIWCNKLQVAATQQSCNTNSSKQFELILSSIRAMCSVQKDKYKKGISELKALYDKNTHIIDKAFNSILSHTLAESYEMLGDYQTATIMHLDSIELSDYSQSNKIRLFGLYELGGIKLAMAQIDEALQYLTIGLEESSSGSMRGAFLSRIARVYMERMDINQAKKYCLEAEGQFSTDRNVDLLVEAHIVHSELMRMQGKLFEAQAILSEADKIAERKQVLRNVDLALAVQKARQALCQNHLSETNHSFESLLAATDIDDYIHQMEFGFLQVDQFYASKEYDDALELLVKLNKIATATHLKLFLQRAEIKKALVLEALNLKKEAMVSLGEALMLGSDQVLIKGFIEGGRPIQMMLLEMSKSNASYKWSKTYLKHILQSYDFSQNTSDARSESKVSMQDSFFIDLTSREKEVLKLLSYGMTRKEISSALFITINTAKAHVSSIYTKAGVHNRDELLKLVDISQLT